MSATRQDLPMVGFADSKPAIFARNQLCALARKGLKVSPANLLETMLDPGVRLGTSTPKAGPSGDYTFALFGKTEAMQTGARGLLEAKALQLIGGQTSEITGRAKPICMGDSER